MVVYKPLSCALGSADGICYGYIKLQLGFGFTFMLGVEMKSIKKKMLPFKEIARRITGFSTPVFGLQWQPPESERERIRTLLTFLEDRRVLYVPHHLEVLHQVDESVLQIRNELTKTLQALPEDSQTNGPVRTMRSACRRFLQEPHPVFCNLPGAKGGEMGWRTQNREEGTPGFFVALGELRSVFGVNIALLSVCYGIDLEDDLAAILPAQDLDGDE